MVSFTSHGAMVDVALPDGGVLHCYIPLTAMGTPPPTKARQVLKKGEVRPFVLAGLDPPRRVAELALPPVAVATWRSDPSQRGSRRGRLSRRRPRRPSEQAAGEEGRRGEEGRAAKKAAGEEGPDEGGGGQEGSGQEGSREEGGGDQEGSEEGAGVQEGSQQGGGAKKALAKKARPRRPRRLRLP